MISVTTALDAFQTHRQRLFGIAYRLLGSATDAEDVLQDAWLRWQGVDPARVSDPAAFLARTVTNLCLTALTSARARREVYVGPWLPEPVFTGDGADGALGPLDDTVQRECVSFALLALMERLSPAERAAYVLREAFAYSPRGRRVDRHHGGQRPPVALPGPAPRRRGAVAGGRRRPLAGVDRPLPERRPRRGRGRAGGPAGRGRRVARRRRRDRERRSASGAGAGERGALSRWPRPPLLGGASADVRRGQRCTGSRPHRGWEPGRRPGAAHRRRAPDRTRPGRQPGEARLRPGPVVADRRPARSEWVRKGETPMTTTLVTGATGTLGTPTVTRLRATGHDVRALSRRSGPGLTTGDLLTGAGIREALTGVDTVLH